MNNIAQPSKPSAKILIAEDSATQALNLQHLLEKHGHEVRVAGNGRLALDLARQRKPTLIISDIVMPVMDGYELCRAIKSDETLKDVPVILVTTLSDAPDVILGLECGANNFLRKPYDERQLLSRVDYLLMNLELRKNQRIRSGVEINLGGRTHFITAERQQILDLLISTYEQAVQVNQELLLQEKKVAHSNRVLTGLHRIAEGLNQAVTEREVAEAALERALELPGIRAGWIVLREGEAGFRLAAARNLPPALSSPDALAGNCACRRKLLSGEFAGATNILECERLSKAVGDTHGLRSHASVPLWLGPNRTIGLMNLAGGAGDEPFDPVALNVLYDVGNQVAVALERARLHEHLEKLVEERTAKLVAEIAERQRTEEALRESQLNYRIVADFTYDWEFWMAPEGRFAYVSPSCQRISGYAPGEFTEAESLLEIVHGEDRKTVQAELKRALLQEVQAGVDFRIVDREGLARWVEMAYQPVRNAAGEFIGARGTVRDVTQRREAEEVQKKRTDELERFHRLSVGRELQMIELKKEVNALAVQLGQSPPYKVFLAATVAVDGGTGHG